ncbi:hypothetical protein CAL29_06180 [Bordetella genomosp. 10]|uniref:Sulfurtransferase n=1 Tax=Bordetella genomosp. 10 TaxID=1416804 RepID=A0A261SLQ3_9BORD|nr:rhodanese-like domain-containing protein [Bordetella genomosp. 10]OZI37947.1 hypothetical protein CAL29_06180 [Bordetella genomosp. 10]
MTSVLESTLREGTLNAETLRALAARTALNLVEIRAQPSTAAPAAAGAVPVFWKDLLWLPDVRDFADARLLGERLRRLGLDPGRPTVLYGEHRQYGFYARWALRHAGLRPVFVLERPEQLAAALPAPAPHLAPPPIDEGPAPRRALRQEVLAALGRRDVQIVDARSREEYDGWRVSPPGGHDHGAERAGHIPGARHLHYLDFLDAHGQLRPDDELHARADAAGLRADLPVIAYCRLSHRASLLVFVLQERLGYADVRLYDGSWTEWGSSVGSPIAHHRPSPPP